MDNQILTKEPTIDQMTLESGTDILIKELNLILNQPYLIDIAKMGQDRYLDALATINFDREQLIGDLTQEEVEKISNFLWIMLLLKTKKQKRYNLVLFLQIIFKEYDVEIDLENFWIILKNKNNEKNTVKITDLNFNILKSYINYVCYSNKKNKSSYNTQSKVAERIAKKLEEGRNKINSMKNKDQKSVFCNAISSLADGLKFPLKTVYNEFTVYQFYNQLKRYQKHEEYEQLMKALLAGAKDIKLESWYEDL